MATRKISASISRQARPATQTRTATVIDVLAPVVDEADVSTGWQVLLDFGGGEIKNAGVASSYNPIPGDNVVVARYLNTLFVIDKVTAGISGDEPGGRAGYAFYDAQASAAYATTGAGAELAVPSLYNDIFMRNGAAYKVEAFTGYQSSVANTWTFFRLRIDNVTGADLGEFYRQPATLANQVYGFQMSKILRNDTGADHTVRIQLCVQAAPAATSSVYATPLTKPYMETIVAGSSKLYPHASPIPVPADFVS